MLRALRRLAGTAVLRLFGWRIEGERELPARFVFIAAPHTSNWDFLFMLATTWALGVDVRWLGKHTLFHGPFGLLSRALGGIPVDRRVPHQLVTELAARFRGERELRLAVPPEGTRKKVERWKSGFYHIAREAGVPIGLGFLDYARRRSGFSGFFEPTGDVRADMDHVRAFYRDIRGKHPERECVPLLKEEDAGASTEAVEGGAPPPRH